MLTLLIPRYHMIKNRLSRRAPGDGLKTLVIFLLGIGFWAFLFTVSFRVLTYFRTVEGLGDLLAFRLLSMVLLTFFSILVFSNVVTALSTFYLSGELEILHSAPVPIKNVFRAKFVETVMDSSWMTIVYGLPVFIGYGAVFKAGPLYYGGVALAVVPFILIPAALGIVFTMLLVSAFPARRARDVLVLLGLLFFVALYILFRMLRPERLVDPDAFPTLVQYLTAMRGPVSPLMPSSWAADALSSLLKGRQPDALFPLLLLWSTSMAGVVIGEWACGRIYYAGWSRSQEGKKARLSRSKLAEAFFRVAVLPFRGTTRAIVLKDIRLFFRDTSQWSQLFLLLALIVVYIYSFKLLPLERAPIPTFFLQNLLSFLNLGMVGFVTAAVAVRFVFPAVSLEGESFWIVRSSPVPLEKFLLAKFWSSVLPLLVLSEILIVLSNVLLQVPAFMMALGVVTVFLMTLGIAGLGIGFGAIFPRFRYENVAQIPTGFGGIAYMLVTMLFIGAVVALESWPVSRIFWSGVFRRTLSVAQWMWVCMSFLVIVALNVLTVILPIKIGIKRLKTREI